MNNIIHIFRCKTSWMPQRRHAQIHMNLSYVWILHISQVGNIVPSKTHYFSDWTPSTSVLVRWKATFYALYLTQCLLSLLEVCFIRATIRDKIYCYKAYPPNQLEHSLNLTLSVHLGRRWQKYYFEKKYGGGGVCNFFKANLKHG